MPILWYNAANPKIKNKSKRREEMLSKFASSVLFVIVVAVIGGIRGYQSYYPQYDTGTWVVTAQDGKIHTSHYNSVWSSPSNTTKSEWVPKKREITTEITMMTKDGVPVRSKLEFDMIVPFKLDQQARDEEITAIAELRQAVQQHYIDLIAKNNYDYINSGAITKSCWGGPCFNTFESKWIKDTLFKVGGEWSGNVIIKEFTPAFQHSNPIAIDIK
jgi:hypothetical protein